MATQVDFPNWERNDRLFAIVQSFLRLASWQGRLLGDESNTLCLFGLPFSPQKTRRKVERVLVRIDE
jgi:hypothetical protein